jgi:hypothetical protein
MGSTAYGYLFDPSGRAVTELLAGTASTNRSEGFAGGRHLITAECQHDVFHQYGVVGSTDLNGLVLLPDMEIRGYLEAAGFAIEGIIEEIIEREPYCPEVEHQSRRAYIFARKSDSQ